METGPDVLARALSVALANARLRGVVVAMFSSRDRRRAEDFVFELKPMEKAE